MGIFLNLNLYIYVKNEIIMLSQIKFPLNNVQIELLKIFDKKLDENEILELKEYLLALKFRKFQKIIERDSITKDYSQEDFEKMSYGHLRTTYKSNLKKQ